MLFVNVKQDGREHDVKNVGILSFSERKQKYFISFLEYFRCQSSGYFVDEFMKNQGKYFWCISYEKGKI